MEVKIWWCHLQIRCLRTQDIILECHPLCILRHQGWTISGLLRHYIFMDLPSVVFLKDWFRQILNLITQCLMVLFLPTRHLDSIWIPSINPHSNSTLPSTQTFLLYLDFQAWMKVQETMWQKMRKMIRKLISSNKLYNTITISIITSHNSIILLSLVGPTCSPNLSTLIWCTTK